MLTLIFVVYTLFVSFSAFALGAKEPTGIRTACYGTSVCFAALALVALIAHGMGVLS